MATGKGQVLELILEDGFHYTRIACVSTLLPSPGQYLLAGDSSNAPLPVPLFYTDSAPQGFVAAAPIPQAWQPGMELGLRGPLGHGFSLPSSARRIGLIALDATPARLKGLIKPALKQDAAVVLVCDSSPDNLPDDVEIQPLSSLRGILEWADYLAIDVRRENLNQVRGRLGKPDQLPAASEAQILIYTPIPCGGIADCGVCAVALNSEWKLACKDGPVFNWREV